MRHYNVLQIRFYVKLFSLMLLFGLFCIALDKDGSFSFIHRQQFSQTINFLFINYSFLGDCIFVFVLSAFVALRYKNSRGVKLFFACLFTFILEQLVENLFSVQPFTLHFEALQNIYPADDGLVIRSLISLNTAMAITCCAMFAKYNKSSLVHLLLMIAVLLMSFCRIYLVQDNFWSIMLALPVSFAAFQLTLFLGNNKHLHRIFRNVGIVNWEKPAAYPLA